MSLLSNVLSWLIFGTVIGGIAYIIEPKFRNIKPFVLGIIGAVLAGIISNMIFNIPLYQFSFVSFFIALSGACFLVFSTEILQNV